MEIHLVRTSTGLRPYTDDDYDEMKKIKVGSIVKANIVRPRNVKFHRKFFALIRAAWDCLTEQQRNNLRSVDTFREQLLITSGFSEPLYDLNGQKFLERAKSISFAKKIEGDEKKTLDDKEVKPITYDDICKDLFYNKYAYYLDESNNVSSWVMTSSNYNDFDNCTSIAQAKRMIAFNKLQNIAKYLNGNWKPDFDGYHKNWNIIKTSNTFIAMNTTALNKASVYFKSEDLVLEAIRLMGEESLNDLFSTDW